jgi:glycosyltransferase involved in cell wall biosynthesis
VKTFIMAAALLREDVKDLRALVIGPTDEEPDYSRECEALADQLGLKGCLEFTGNVQIIEWLPKIHVVALTSLSEAQPLVLLEAGAAGVPCVTTNVGSCAEILNGRPDEVPPFGRGGIVTDVVAPREIARALRTLLTDPSLRKRCGEALQARVRHVYANERAVKAYRELYERCRTQPRRVPAGAGRS